MSCCPTCNRPLPGAGPKTPRQREILEFLIEHEKHSSFAPTYAEIGNVLGLCPEGVYQHVTLMEALKLISRKGRGKHRKIQILCYPRHEAAESTIQRSEPHVGPVQTSL